MRNRKEGTLADLTKLYRSTFNLPKVYRALYLPPQSINNPQLQQLATYLSLLNTRVLQLHKEAQLIQRWQEKLKKGRVEAATENQLQEASTLLKILQQKREQVKLFFHYLTPAYSQSQGLKQGMASIIDSLVEQVQLFISPSQHSGGMKLSEHQDKSKHYTGEQLKYAKNHLSTSELTRDSRVRQQQMPCRAEKVKLSLKKKKTIKRFLTEAEVDDIRSSCSGKYRTQTFFKHLPIKQSNKPNKPVLNRRVNTEVIHDEITEVVPNNSTEYQFNFSQDRLGTDEQKQTVQIVKKSRFALNRKKTASRNTSVFASNQTINSSRRNITSIRDDSNSKQFERYKAFGSRKKINKKLSIHGQLESWQKGKSQANIDIQLQQDDADIRFGNECPSMMATQQLYHKRRSSDDSDSGDEQHQEDKFNEQPSSFEESEQQIQLPTVPSNVRKPSTRYRDSFARPSSNGSRDSKFKRRVGRLSKEQDQVIIQPPVIQKAQKFANRRKRIAVFQHKESSYVASKRSSKPRISHRGSSMVKKKTSGNLFLKISPQQMRFEDLSEDIRSRVSEVMGRKRSKSKDPSKEQEKAYEVDSFALVSEEEKMRLLAGINKDARIFSRTRTEEQWCLEWKRRYGLTSGNSQAICLTKLEDRHRQFRIDERQSAGKQKKAKGHDGRLLDFANMTIHHFGGFGLAQRGLQTSDIHA